jgi:hypothetical protein
MKQHELEKTEANPAAENIASPPLESITLFSSFLLYVLNGAGILVLAAFIFMSLDTGSWGVLVIFTALPALAVCILSLTAASRQRQKTRRAALIINVGLLLILLAPLQGWEILFSPYHSSNERLLFSIAFIPLAANLILLACLEIIILCQARLAAARESSGPAQP